MNRLLILFLFVCQLSYACLWDRDTYAMEKQAFPEIIDLISGNFVRHSPEYYQWRIKDRESKLKQEPNNLSYYDDLAVAYSKLGNDKKAIELMFEKEKIKPDLYETYANLGTFYIHDNQLEKGLEYIDKAIEINPDAHFGREIYQKYVVEYILEKRKKDIFQTPLGSNYYEDNFYTFLVKKLNPDYNNDDYFDLSSIEIRKAIKGISGMMRFGNYDSPILLECLGDLLFNDEYNEEMSAKRLASIAYLKAQLESGNIEYENRARTALSIQHSGGTQKIEQIQKILKTKILKGEKRYNNIRNNELKWINKNKDVDYEFNKKYYSKSR